MSRLHSKVTYENTISVIFLVRYEGSTLSSATRKVQASSGHFLLSMCFSLVICDNIPTVKYNYLFKLEENLGIEIPLNEYSFPE